MAGLMTFWIHCNTQSGISSEESECRCGESLHVRHDNVRLEARIDHCPFPGGFLVPEEERGPHAEPAGGFKVGKAIIDHEAERGGAARFSKERTVDGRIGLARPRIARD